YMPASAFIPLLIIWFGIYEKEKIAVIFIGVFFPLTLLIADVSANIPKELLNIAYTLGASRWQVFWRVLLPASWPGVLDNMRIGIGWAWTYLIVAELVAASTGIGHVILSASRFLQTDKIIAGIITIGILRLPTADLGERPTRRPPDPRPGHGPWDGLPVVHALPVAARAGERRVRPEAERHAEGRATADLPPAARGDGARGVRPRLSEGALGRDEAAGGDRPRARERPEGAADGRAVRGA